jgi:outer membrane receptor protein involved in Fe transport
MMRFRTTAVLLLILLGITLDANAQSTGRVSGRVLDQTGAVLPGVVIDLPVNSRELTTTSDDGGRYRFDGVPAGNAELTFRLLNFSVLRRTVAVATGASVTADVVLTLSLSADVIVTGTSPRGGSIQADGIQPVSSYLDADGAFRVRLWTTREDELGQTMAAVYAQTEVEWTRTLRTTVGVRADRYQFSVTSDNPLNSGDGSDGLVSPKLGAIFGPWSGTEIYVNAGTGFHSNDARGAAITVDPVTGEPVDRVTPLVRARGAEIGLRTVRIRGLQSTVALWYLGIDSELLFVGDAGTTEAGRPSRRIGLEWTNYARLQPWLTLDADLAFTRARLTDDDPAGTRIPGALDRVISAGLTFEPKQPFFGSIRVRHFGPRPLIEDATVTSNSTTIWNGELGYRLSSKARIVLEAFNLFDAEVSDIDYFYASRLPGEPEGGVEDIHLHPALPRSARIGIQFFF